MDPSQPTSNPDNDGDTEMPDASPLPPREPDYRLPTETVSQFLERLPPVVPPEQETATRPDWFWIRPSNPINLRPRDQRHIEQENIERFIARGRALLQEFAQDIALWPRSESMQQRLRERLGDAIADAARERGVTVGKWLIHAPPTTLPPIWHRIAEAVSANLLGIGAKVSTKRFENSCSSGVPDERVICVYTKDFTDVEDVKRVLLALAELGVVGKAGIKYKCDAYTYLGIYSKRSGVGWSGLKASLYDSCDEEFLGSGGGKGGKAGDKGWGGWDKGKGKAGRKDREGNRGGGQWGNRDGNGEDGDGWQVVRGKSWR
ncbi:hypothetical protein B0T19DRAFT_4045 [Cercophora scortea]|uniref:DUF1917-domain-containing protein n=1 Tax=Cercophora scortea TaxID=314031 RepID=A0AAE0MJZ2_9PEZI|nr:hypothetical protein B0T19DRAFT_4045 [Cercophora scortea]